MTFEKGKSGNPDGRPPGFQHREFFDKILKGHKADLLNMAIKKASKSPIILKFLLERFTPKVSLHPLEYEKLLLENEKLKKENKLLDEAPALLELLKEDPQIKESLQERMRHRKRITLEATVE